MGLLVTSAILSSCATGGAGVTAIDICMEIPFLDAPEAACTNTVTHKGSLIDAKKWAEERPYYLMIHVDEWTEVKKDWLKGCRMLIADGKKCAVAVDSIDSAIKKLDSMTKGLIKAL